MKKVIYLLIAFLPYLLIAQTKRELKVINNAAKDIKMSVDKFEGSTDWYSPYYGKNIAATTPKRLGFSKVKDKDGKLTNYLWLMTYSSSLKVNEKGVIILFQDGTRIEKPNAKIDADNDTATAYWKYSAYIKISDEELEMFATKKVDAFRLYVYEGRPITKKAVLQLMGYARAMQKIK